MEKKLFKITARQAAIEYWEYEVEATSEEEAIEIIDGGYADPVDYGVDSHEFSKVDYEIWDIDPIIQKEENL
jgi:hypothetical protein